MQQIYTDPVESYCNTREELRFSSLLLLDKAIEQSELNGSIHNPCTCIKLDRAAFVQELKDNEGLLGVEEGAEDSVLEHDISALMNATLAWRDEEGILHQCNVLGSGFVHHEYIQLRLSYTFAMLVAVMQGKKPDIKKIFADPRNFACAEN